VQEEHGTDEDHSVRDYLEGNPPLPGRLLIESGQLVAGSMAATAAVLVFDPSSARVQLPRELANALVRVAQESATPSGESAVQRMQCRAGGALAFAVELSVTRAGEQRRLRTDGFFDEDVADRSAFAEVAEAVVLTARRTVEEWRIRHLGYAIAEAAFSADLDADVVLRGLRLAESLTGRQLAFLAAVGRRERVHLPMAPPLPVDPRGWREWGALEDLTDLRQRGLLDPPPAQPRPGGAPLPRLRASDLRLARRGVLVHRLLALDLLHDDRVTAALADLGLPRS
jgi:hypothetical protein